MCSGTLRNENIKVPRCQTRSVHLSKQKLYVVVSFKLDLVHLMNPLTQSVELCLVGRKIRIIYVYRCFNDAFLV